MEEKILVKSQQYNAKKGFLIALLAITLIFAIISSCICFNELVEEFHNCEVRCNRNSNASWHHSYPCPGGKPGEQCVLLTYSSAEAYALANFNIILYLPPMVFETIVLGYPICLLIALFVFLRLKSYELTVTDKRIYGRVAWGKRVDLPQDSISALSTVSMLKGIAASTSSGAIKFLLIKNADEIYEIMNNLLIERQQKAQSVQPAIKQEIPQSSADELKKYKELLDSGVITQEEFDAKKKQLLGL